MVWTALKNFGIFLAVCLGLGVAISVLAVGSFIGIPVAITLIVISYNHHKKSFPDSKSE